MSENKLKNIEEMLAHYGQQIQDLSEMVTRQWSEIDHLKKHMTKMKDKINVLEDTSSASDGEELSVTEMAARDKPPHY